MFLFLFFENWILISSLKLSFYYAPKLDDIIREYGYLGEGRRRFHIHWWFFLVEHFSITTIFTSIFFIEKKTFSVCFTQNSTYRRVSYTNRSLLKIALVRIATKAVIAVTVVYVVISLMTLLWLLLGIVQELGIEQVWAIRKCIWIVVITVKVATLLKIKVMETNWWKLAIIQFKSHGIHTWQSKHLQFSVNSQDIANRWAAASR